MDWKHFLLVCGSLLQFLNSALWWWILNFDTICNFFLHLVLFVFTLGFSGGSGVKEPSCNAGDTEDAGSIPGSGRAPEGGHGLPLQHSCLENPMDRGAWWATAPGVANHQTRLSKWGRVAVLEIWLRRCLRTGPVDQKYFESQPISRSVYDPMNLLCPKAGLMPGILRCLGFQTFSQQVLPLLPSLRLSRAVPDFWRDFCWDAGPAPPLPLGLRPAKQGSSSFWQGGRGLDIHP